MASEMRSAYMVMELYIVEEELLAEVTPGMRQNFCSFFRTWVTILDVRA
jgi:hypothetical protein